MAFLVNRLLVRKSLKLAGSTCSNESTLYLDHGPALNNNNKSILANQILYKASCINKHVHTYEFLN